MLQDLRRLPNKDFFSICRITRRPDVRCSVPIQTRRRNRLRKHNPYRHKNRPASRRKRHRHLYPRPLWIFVPTSKTQSALRQILANRHFLLKSPPPYTRQNPRFHPRPISPRNYTFFDRQRICRYFFLRLDFRLRFNPNGRRIAMFAKPRHAFPHFKRLQFHLIQINDFASLAKSALHQQPRQRLIRLIGGREVDVPEIRSRLRDLNCVQKSVRLLIDLRHHTRSRRPYQIAFHPPQRNLLSRRQLRIQSQNSAIAAYQKRLRGVLYSRTVARRPRCLHGHPETYAVALPQSVASHCVV
jgi:hypothetical protein